MIYLDDKTFTVERGDLVMRVLPRFGPRRLPYRHVCTLAALEAVVHAIDEAGRSGIDRRGLTAGSGARHTQVAVAMAFLVERGIVEEFGPRLALLRSGGGAHMDAMTEYWALAEGEEPEVGDVLPGPQPGPRLATDDRPA